MIRTRRTLNLLLTLNLGKSPRELPCPRHVDTTLTKQLSQLNPRRLTGDCRHLLMLKYSLLVRIYRRNHELTIGLHQKARFTLRRLGSPISTLLIG